MFGDIYAGRRVLVTGHTGFKGSWLTEWLIQLGVEVVGISLEPEADPSLFRILGLKKRIFHYHILDIRHADVLA